MMYLEEMQQLVAEGKKTRYHISKRLCELARNSWGTNDVGLWLR